jgi:hypothetical protein
VTATPTPGGGATETLVPTPESTANADTSGLADAVAAKSALKCHQTIEKSGTAFLANRLKQLGVCAATIVKCIQLKADDPTCLPKAQTKCLGIQSTAAAARAKLAASIQGKCNGVLVSPTDLRGSTGLGYEHVDADCTAELGHAPADVTDVAECIARRYVCQASALFDTQMPRAGELWRVAGVTAENCLPDHGGDGAGIGDVVQGKAIQQCAAVVTKAASGFLAKKLASLTKCVDKVVACIQTKPGDASCLAKADAACGKEAAKIAAERAKVGPAIDKKCGALDFDSGLRPPTAANLAALVNTLPGADTVDTLASYETGLRLRHECAAEDLLRVIAPRAATLLQALAPSLPLPSAACSAP